jgi:membrane protein
MTMQKSVAHIRRWFKTLHAAVFERPDPDGAGGWKGALFGIFRILVAVVRDILEGQLTLRAMSLVYTTLLSLVPLIAISFSVLKGFGVHNQVEPMLLGLLEPLGEKATEITERIIEFVDNIQVGVLGFLGLLLLFYTVVSLLEKVERAFNYIWHVPRARPLSQKVRDYLALVVLGPVAVIGAIGVFSSLLASSIVGEIASLGPMGHVIAVASRFVTLFLVSIVFTFLYMFIPNTRVRFAPALIGGLAAGIMWTVIGWGFASFIVASVRYAAIYSGFATLILFMIWLYVVWLILLTGSVLSFYVQNPQYIGLKRDGSYSIQTKESAALSAIWHIVRAYYGERPGWTADALGRHTRTPMPVLCEVLDELEQAGLIKRTGESNDLYVPGRPPEETSVGLVRQVVRGTVDKPVGGTDGDAAKERIAEAAERRQPAAVGDLMQRMDRAVETSLSGMTLKEFAMSDAGHGDKEPASQVDEDSVAPLIRASGISSKDA